MALRLLLDRRIERWRAGPGGRLALRVGVGSAGLYRRALGDVCFVGVTGSAGKTTAKELIAAVLAPHLDGTKTPGARNRLSAVARTVLRVRPWHDVCVVEVATSRPGDIARIVRLVRPRIGVVTVVGADHRKSFKTLEEIAAEKSGLVAALPPDGVAVLNADDPLVRGMAALTRARVLTYGCASDATLRAEDVQAAWPGTLSFTLVHGGRSYPVTTRLYGAHALPGVLAALAVAVALELPLEQAIATLATVEPMLGRMSPYSAGGVSFIRDDFKAPLWGFDGVFAFLAEAQAERKVLVLGRVTNFSRARAKAYRQLVARALEVVDEVVVVGPDARYVRERWPAGTVVGLDTVEEAATHLRATLSPGDLVLVKGSEDHLARVALAFEQDVRCWRTNCGRRMLCDACSLLLR